MSYPAVSRQSAEAIAGRIRDSLASGFNPLATVLETDGAAVEMRNGGDYDRTSLALPTVIYTTSAWRIRPGLRQPSQDLFTHS